MEIIKIDYRQKHITLIPTAHVSKESAELTERVINELQPDSICIELDQDRYNSLTDPEKFKNTDVVKIIKDKKVSLMLVTIILSNYQRKLATNLESKNGQEMMIGINKAKELNADLVLADRSVSTTFKRIWANLTLIDKFKLIYMIISSIFDEEEITEEDLAKLQQSDMLSSALNEVSKAFPHITEVLVDERDKYLAHKIKNAPGENIVAILGAAHTVNVPKYIEQDYSIEEYDKIPEKKLSSKLVGWIIPVAIVVAIIASFRLDSNIGLSQIKTWILFNGTFSAIGTLIGGGHIITALLSFIVAPITSLNPLLAAGWFAGLLEAKLQKPTVADFDSLATDLNNVKGFWKNKVTRIMLIVVLANIGSTIGTFVSGFGIFKNIIDLL